MMNCQSTEAQPIARAEEIAQQNDRFRQTWGADFTIPGRVKLTRGVQEKGAGFMAQAMKAVMQFDFEVEKDPYGERDFGAFTIEGERLFWKLDLYDSDYRYGTPDPLNRSVTRRVLTVMLASEY